MNVNWAEILFTVPVPLLVVLSLWLLTANGRFWRSLPTLDEYLEENPNCRTGKGIACSKCGGRSIRNWGLTRADDLRRCFVCNHCGTYLHRGS